MATPLAILYVLGGGIYLVMGGDLLVRGAIALSRKLGIPTMAVGLTVVALGTSAPELVVSLRAALSGYPELALGNVVGSNTANVLLVLGLPALVYPLACDQPGVDRDGLFMLLATAVFFLLCSTGALGRLDGVLLLAGLGAFAAYVLRASGLREVWASESVERPWILGLPSRPAMIALFLVLGGLWLPLGAELLIRGAVDLAATFALPNEVIGATLVAVSTSLPELATSLVAAWKREVDVAVGNVLGSNVLNIFAIMGATAVASPVEIPVPPQFRLVDLPVMLAAALALAVLAARKATISRALGGVFVGGWILYVAFLLRTPR